MDELDQLQMTTVKDGGIMLRYGVDKDAKEEEKESHFIYYYYQNNCTLSGGLPLPSSGTSHRIFSLVSYSSSTTIVSSSYLDEEHDKGENEYECIGSRYKYAVGVAVDDGALYVGEGCTASNTTVYDNLTVWGAATNTTVNGGHFSIYDGGFAYDTTVYAASYMHVYGVAFDNTVNSGSLEIATGITRNTTVNQGYMRLYGGAAYNTTINGGLMSLFSSSCMISGTTLNSGASVNLNCSGTANDTTINSGGSMSVNSNGVISCTAVNFGGLLTLGRWGSATALDTVENGGYVSIYYGVSATFVPNTISALDLIGDSASVHSNTVASDITVCSNGRLDIFYSGTATGTTVSSGGTFNVYSGGTVDNTMVAGGSLVVSSDGVANNTTVDSGGSTTIYFGGIGDCITIGSDGLVILSSGIANSTTVNSGGSFSVNTGEANSTTVNVGGSMSINYAVAKATEIMENGGYVNANTGEVEFVSHAFTGALLSGDSATAHSGTTACNTTIASNGRLEIYRGGTAETTTVNTDGVLIVSPEGTVISTTLNSGGSIFISGGVADNTTVNFGGSMIIYGFPTAGNMKTYGVATGIIENGGFVSANNITSATFSSNSFSGIVLSSASATVHSGTTAIDTTIGEGGVLSAFSGGILTGQTTIVSGGTIFADTGAILDFDISELTQDAPARVNDLSAVWFLPTIVLTVSETQEYGIYLLAEAATGFYNSYSQSNHGPISVFDPLGKELGTLILGTPGSIIDTRYTIKLEDETLVVSIGDQVEVYKKRELVSSGSALSEIALSADAGNSMFIYSGGTATGTTADANTRIVVSSGGTAADTTVNGKAFLELENCAVLGGTTTLTGTIRNKVEDKVTAENATIDLMVDGAPYLPGDGKQQVGYITSLNSLDGATLSITVTENSKLNSTYLLADNAADYHSDVTLTVTGEDKRGCFTWNAQTQSYAPVKIGDITYSLWLQPDEQSGTTGLYLTIADPISDAAYEYTARKLAYYKGHSSYKEGDFIPFTVNEDDMIKEYWFRVEKIFNESDGFDAVLLERMDQNKQYSLKQAVLACGGTEGLTDAFSDALVSGIGYNQFFGKLDVYQSCRDLIKQGCSLSLTGHSLGGALAQWFAAFSSRYGAISQLDSVVTFNSPGLPDTEKVISAESETHIWRIRHYVNDGDPVSMAGNYFLSNAEDAAFTLFSNTERWSNPFDYILAQHSNTLFFLYFLDGKPNRDDSLAEVASGDISVLSSGSFSYLTVHSNRSPDFLNVLTPVEDPAGGFWLFNNQYAQLILNVAGDDLFLANDLVTRKGTEIFRKTFSPIDLLGINKYADIINKTVDAAYVVLHNNPLKNSLSVGHNDAVISKDSNIRFNNAVIRSLTFAPYNNPYAFFDFLNQQFIRVDNVTRSVAIEDDPLLQTNSINIQITLSDAFDTLKLKSSIIPRCFKAPEYLSNPRYTLTGIVCEDYNRTLSASDIFYADGSYWYCVDNPLMKHFRFTLAVDQSITKEKAVMDVSQQTIKKDTEVIELFISDIDAVGDSENRSRAVGNKTISVQVKTASDPDGITVQLKETELEGLFSGTVSLSVLNLTDADDHLTIVYEDADNGEGVAETIEKVIDIDNIEWPDNSDLFVVDLPSFFYPGDFNGDGCGMLAVEMLDLTGDEPYCSVAIYENGAEWGVLAIENGWDVFATGNFDGDGRDDFLRVSDEGYVVGEMSNGDGTFTPQVLNFLSAGWDILGTGDFDGSGADDVLIANPTAASETVGLLGYWKGGTEWTLINGYSPEWKCVSTGDFNGDGKCDMLWKNSFEGEGGLIYNAYCTWIVEDPVDWRMVSVANPDEWNFLCSGDFDGDGSHDIAMINDVGVVGIWGVNDGYLSSWSILSAVDPFAWTLAGVADFNADGTDDIAWSNSETGLTGYWQINDKELATWQSIVTLS